VGIHEVLWEKGDMLRAGYYNFSMEKEIKISNWEQDFVYHRIVSAVRTEFVSDRMSYIVLRGHWYIITLLNVHASNEAKSED
jgi:hypothetical protein